MGRSKAKRKPAVPQSKRKLKLDKSFNCPFCNSEKTVDCKLYDWTVLTIILEIV